MIKLKSPKIYVGLFDTEGYTVPSEDQYSYYPEAPIGIAYCCPNSNKIKVAVAENGYHSQLNAAYSGVSIETSPRSRYDRISAIGWQQKRFRRFGRTITKIAYSAPERPPDLEQNEYENYILVTQWSARVLATVLHYNLQDYLPAIGDLCEMDIPKRILNSNPKRVKYN